MKPFDLRLERFKRFRPVAPTDKKRAGIPQNTRHMTNQFLRRPNLVSGLEIGETVGRSANRFLRPVRESSKEVPQHFAFFVQNNLLPSFTSNKGVTIVASPLSAFGI